MSKRISFWEGARVDKSFQGGPTLENDNITIRSVSKIAVFWKVPELRNLCMEAPARKDKYYNKKYEQNDRLLGGCPNGEILRWLIIVVVGLPIA